MGHFYSNFTASFVAKTTDILALTKLQKNKLLLVSLFLISPSFLFAQDIIIKNDKSELKAKVVEITDDYIKYHDWDNLTGPIYNISRAQVFMINYQNGKREFITSNTDNKTETKVTTKTTNTNTAKVTNTETPVSSSPYTFTPRDKSQPKSYTNFADRVAFTGVTVDQIGKLTIPTISSVTDIFVAPNIAIATGMSASYNQESILGYNYKSSSIGVMAGPTYYLNEVLKIDKNKGGLYGGAALAYTFAFASEDFTGTSTTAGSFGVFARAGGFLSFSKKLGAFAEVHVGEGGASVVAGISFKTTK